ncbi:hypothetical protein [Chromobacterium vaccinii]|uniref:hypothetical protein n=1 Tax=Chromobacterium vaccinii TaxID=1108595 RepID=UPI0011856F18|nr:hypothetical protein [Chromobacterium vaccinii]
MYGMLAQRLGSARLQPEWMGAPLGMEKESHALPQHVVFSSMDALGQLSENRRIMAFACLLVLKHGVEHYFPA